jgi:hypothetical protein
MWRNDRSWGEEGVKILCVSTSAVSEVEKLRRKE